MLVKKSFSYKESNSSDASANEIDEYYKSMVTSKRQIMDDAFRNFELLQDRDHALASKYIDSFGY
jgi:hypothetical protein